MVSVHSLAASRRLPDRHIGKKPIKLRIVRRWLIDCFRFILPDRMTNVLKMYHLFSMFANVLVTFILLSDCGGISSGTNGVITSPNYPDDYVNANRCAWLIVAPEGTTITVSHHDNKRYRVVQ